MSRFTYVFFRFLAVLIFSLCLSSQAWATTLSAPEFSKVFLPDTIGPGSVSTLTFTIDNLNNTDEGIDSIAFTDTLPAGMTIAAGPVVSNGCEGTLTAAAGGDTISLTGGRVVAGAICTITVDITAIAVANSTTSYTNTTGDLTSLAGNSGTASDDLTVDVGLPAFSKSFSTGSVVLGDRAPLTFTIENTLNGSAVGNLDFTDSLPTGLTIASPSSATTDCISPALLDTNLTAAPGSSIITLDANGSTMFPGLEVLGAGATCTVTVDVVATATGTLINSSGELRADFVTAGKANATIESTFSPLAMTTEFTDDPTPPGGTVTLDFVITNFSRSDSATNVSFTEALPAGLTFAGLLSNDCDGSVVSGVGDSSVAFESGTIAPAGQCTISTSLSVAGTTAPGWHNLSAPSPQLSADVGGSTVNGSTGLDAIYVASVPLLTKEFLDAGDLSVDPVVLPGDDVVLRFTISNTSTTSGATDITFVDELTDGSAGIPPDSTSGFLPFPVTVALPSEPCGVGSSLSLVSRGTDRQALELTAGSLAASPGPGDTCTFDVTLTIPTGLAPNVYTNTTEEVTATVDGATRTGIPASADLTVVGAPTLSKSFTNDPVAPGQTVTLEFTITHSDDAADDATGITFTDDLATLSIAGLAASLPVSPDPPCGSGSTLTGSVGDTLLTLTGGTLSPGEFCTFSVPLDVPVGTAPGSYTNTTSEVSAISNGLTVTSAAASDDLNVSELTFTKEFLTNPVIAGDTTTLGFTINNIHPTADATTILFTDSLTTALTGLAATGPPSIDTCGGTLSGTTSLSYSGGSVLSGQSCTIEVEVLVPAAAANGTYINTTSSLSAIQGGAVTVDPARDELVVNSAQLQLSKEFTDDPVEPGGTVTLKFTLTNLDTDNAVSDIAFSDDLAAAFTGLTFSSVLFDDCGGTITGAGTTSFDLSGGSLAAGGSCTIRVALAVPGSASTTVVTNTTTDVAGTIGTLAVTGAAASDALEIQSADTIVAIIGAAKSASVLESRVTIDIYLENLGNATLNAISVDDDLDGVFGAGNYSITSPPAIVDDPGTITLNSGFNGGGDSELIDSSSTLAVADTARIRFIVDVYTLADNGSGLGVYTNQVTASGITSYGSTTSDLSDNGTDPDPDGDRDPSESSEDDATPISITQTPVLGAAKSVSVSGGLVTIDLYLENFGNVSLSNLNLAEDLDSVFGVGNYSISSGPAFINDPGSITLNSAFNGSSDTALIASGTLATVNSAQIRLVVDVHRLADTGSGVGVYTNQVTASAQGPDSTLTSDLSDNGTDPDSNGNGDPSETGENDATPISITQAPVLGAAKSVSVSGGLVTIDLYLENFGNVNLSNLNLAEDLDSVFGVGNYSISSGPAFINDPGSITLNSGFNGSSDTALIASGTLAVVDTAQIRLVVDVHRLADTGSGVGVYTNQVTASAQGPDSTLTSDLSDNGTTPDPNGNGDPSEAGEDDATPISITQTPVLGAAKSVSVSGGLVTIDLYLENLGNVDLSNLNLGEDLDSVFGVGNYSISSGPAFINDPGSITLNSGFNGSSDTALIASGTLAVVDTAQIRLVVDVHRLADTGSGVGVYTNQVTASAQGPDSTLTSDLSDNGTTPDPNGNGDPSEAGEDDATPISITQTPVLGAAKSVSVSGGLVTIDLYLENLGNVDLSNLNLAEDLDSVFGVGNYSISSGPAFINDPGSITLNSGFNGSSDTALIASGTLAVVDTAQIRLVVDVHRLADTGSGLGVYTNQVTASAQGPDSTLTSDLSDNGTNPDPNGNGDPSNAGENDTTPISITQTPVLGAAKSVSVSGGLVTIDLYLENFGNVSLSNLNLAEDLGSVFGVGNYSISSGPAFINDPGSITLNSAFNGSSDTALIASGTLAVVDTAQIRLVVDVHRLADTGSGVGVYTNQVTASAQGPDSTLTSDLSDNGTNPDPNGNGDPSEAGENDTTPINMTQTPVLGAAKSVSVSGGLVTIDLYLENFGNVNLSNLNLAEDLDSVFGVGNYNISSGPAFINDPGSITLNSGFNGSSDTALIASGTLAVVDTAQIRLVVDVHRLADTGSGVGVYTNQVTASAQGPDSTLTSDLSDNGTNPDPNGNGDPSEAGENDTTPISITQTPVLGAAKSVSVSDGLVTIDLYLENFGNVNLSNLNLAEDLDSVFGVGNYSISSGPVFINDPGSITLNSAFNGSSDTALIASGTLAAVGTAQIRLVVDVHRLADTGSGLGVYTNQVTASAQGPDSTLTSDLSDNGTNPDPNGNGDPSDANENDASPISITQSPVLGAANSVSVSGGLVTINFYLENLGNVSLSNLDLAEDLDSVFGVGNYSISSGPAFINDPGSITLNSAFNGSSDTALIASGTLAAVGTAQIRLVVDVHRLADTGSGVGVYTNQLTASAQGPDSTLTSDLSDNGTDPDPNGNGDPSEAGENDATPIILTQTPVLGAAKNGAVTQKRKVTFDFYLKNFGNVVLSSLSLTDDLDSVFGAGNYLIVSGPVLVDDPGSITLNSGFNGSGDTSIISSGSLASEDTAQIQIVVDVHKGEGSFFNSATVSALGPSGGATSDLSTNGTDPDPNGNGNPGDTGEDEPTAVIIEKFSWAFLPAIIGRCPAEPLYCYIVSDGDNEDSTNSGLLKYNFRSETLELVNRLGASDVEASVLSLDGKTLYATDNGVFGVIDTTPGATKSFTPVNSAGVGEGFGGFGVVSFNDIDGLAFNPNTGVLYGSVKAYPPGEGVVDLLIQINPATGRSVVNAFGPGVDYVPITIPAENVQNIDDITIDGDGVMYGISITDGGADQALTIDQNTGAATLLFEVFDGSNVPIIDIEGWTLYKKTIYSTTGTSPDTDNSLYMIDKETGTAKLITPLDQDFNGYVPKDFEAISCYPVCK